MYYFSTKSRKHLIHIAGCHHVAGIQKGNLGSFTNLKDAYREGYQMCQCCNPLNKRYKLEGNSLLEYCAQNGVSFKCTPKAIAVETPRSRWKISLDDNSSHTMLYHQNTYHPGSEDCELVPGYHCQHVVYATLLPYFQYIVEHDTYRWRNPLPFAPQKKPPAQKGTKRYRKEQKRAKQRAKSASVKNVIRAIDSLQMAR